MKPMKTTTINFKLNDPPATLLRLARAELWKTRLTTPRPKTFAWQIKLYDFILESNDPNGNAKVYFRTKREGNIVRDFAGTLRSAARAVGLPEPFPRGE